LLRILQIEIVFAQRNFRCATVVSITQCIAIHGEVLVNTVEGYIAAWSGVEPQPKWSLMDFVHELWEIVRAISGKILGKRPTRFRVKCKVKQYFTVSKLDRPASLSAVSHRMSKTDERNLSPFSSNSNIHTI